jgi:competence protein ComEA
VVDPDRSDPRPHGPTVAGDPHPAERARPGPRPAADPGPAPAGRDPDHDPGPAPTGHHPDHDPGPAPAGHDPDHGPGLLPPPHTRPGPVEGLLDLGDRLGVDPWRAVVGAAVVAVAALALWWTWARGGPAPDPAVSLPWASTTTTAPPTTAPAPLLVHAAGAVSAPGVYRLEPGSRVGDLLAAAGGPAADADLDRLNLAAPVADGDRVWVPAVGVDEVPAVVGPAPAPPGGGDDGVDPPVDLNAATPAELESLPGVGPAIAAAIVEHRDRIGRFASVDELLDVRGIGEAKLAALRDRVLVP